MQTREEMLKLLPPSVFVKNHPLKRYVNDVISLLPGHFPIDYVVFITEHPDVWRSPLAHINEDAKFAILGCGYCMSKNHKYDSKNGTLYVSGSKAISLSKKINIEGYEELAKYIFFCPFCRSPIDRHAKEAGIIGDPEKMLSKETLQQIMKDLRSNK